MTAAEFFAAANVLPVGSLGDIAGAGGLVVVAPHPDDESLGCGGLIAAAVAHKTAVRLVVVSDGTGSHPNSRAYPAARLRALREAETRAAMAALGLPAETIRFLRLPDRFVPVHGPEAVAAREAILAAIVEVKAGGLCVTWGRDPHCDHAAAAALVAGLAPRLGETRIWAYPVWGWTLPPDTEVGAPPRGWRIDVAAHRGAKARAIAAHASQTTGLIDDDPSGFRLAPEMIARFARSHEFFFDVRGIA